LVVVGCTTTPATLTGVITDAYTGEPGAGALVEVGARTSTTSDEGVFSIARWSTRDTLEVRAPQYEALALPLAGRPELAGTNALTVTLNTSLRPNSLTGVVLDEFTGTPVREAQVVATFAVTQTLTTTTDLEGRYTLNGLPEQFTFTVEADDFAPASEELARTTAFDLNLRPNVLAGTITDRYTAEGVAGATVQVGDVRAQTDASGTYRVTGIPADAVTVEISADGYATLSQELGQVTALDAVLRPDTLRGRLIDKDSGQPVVNAAIFATTTFPGTDVAFERIVDSQDGSFTLPGLPEQGYLQVLSPGYRTEVIPIEPGNVPTEIALERFRVKALYVTSAVASVPNLLENYIELIE
ncbi:MAG: hypothetical protein EOM24_35835, partial [Chloroflexia bacterium]|nr:hypothetical protein [Chloroflexia bacterium]